MPHEVSPSPRRHPVHPALTEIVREILIDPPNTEKSPVPYRVLPGLSAVMGFQYRGHLTVQRPGRVEPLAASGITGLRSDARWFLPRKETRSILIQFTPYGLFQLLRCDMSEFAEQHLPLDQIVSGIRQIDEQIHDCPWDQAAEIVERWLLSRLGHGGEVHPDIPVAVARILASHGQQTIQQLADDIAISKRQLERLFRAQVGVGPKEFASLAQFNWIISNWTNRPSWCDLAIAAGYSDQAHFIRSFRARTGVTPGEFNDLRRAAPIASR